MIKEKIININITPNTLNKYKLKYDCKVGDNIFIKTEDLSDNSPKKWNINKNKRIKYDIGSGLPYIIDTGKIILEKKC